MNNLRIKVKKFIEQRPALWSIVWDLIHTNKIFLPHDLTYNSARYLVKTKSPMILDIGANKGISALSFNKIIPDANIISFEPNIALSKDLQKIIKRIKDFKFHLNGLGVAPGQFTLYVPRYKEKWLHTFASLNKQSVITALEATYLPKTRKGIFITELSCEIKTLDSYNYAPDLIKIDAEGMEEDIIEGANDTIKRNMPAIIFEAIHGSVENIVEKLRVHGYEIYNFNNKLNLFSKVNMPIVTEYFGQSRNLIAIPENLKVPLEKSNECEILKSK